MSSESEIRSPKPGPKISLKMAYAEVLEIKEIQRKQIEELQARNRECEQKIAFLEKKVNNFENQLVANSIEIVNIPPESVDCSTNLELALKVFRNGLAVDVNESDIDYCYMKKVQRRDQNKENIIPQSFTNILSVRLTTRHCKEKIMKARNGRKEQLTTGLLNTEVNSQKIYINEGLSYQTRQLLKSAKQLQISKKYKFAWTKNGIVYMRKIEGENIIRILSVADFDKL
ncbi:uncharacterized protein LOC129906383 [Episyrphus balteatus]|uniref:uncharacterized protein LOC129906383 n=1 Tax=Episyrphus balteatus TaxID=286459 RepID=UPI0024863943|nr:uncharacterized protein LOC129906383 [Episyrphus balteatus]